VQAEESADSQGEADDRPGEIRANIVKGNNSVPLRPDFGAREVDEELRRVPIPEIESIGEAPSAKEILLDSRVREVGRVFRRTPLNVGRKIAKAHKNIGLRNFGFPHSVQWKIRAKPQSLNYVRGQAPSLALIRLAAVVVIHALCRPREFCDISVLD